MKDDKKNSKTYNFDVDFSYVPEFKEGKIDKETKIKQKSTKDKKNINNLKDNNNE